MRQLLKAEEELIDIKKSIVDGIFARIYKLQEEKEHILKEIQDEENSILEKYGRKNNRSRR
ncbi:MAG: hypothetical protein IKG93_12840 [Clostridiales bacterium]|nr:hypothetical protein [Clostridiales bacterium]